MPTLPRLFCTDSSCHSDLAITLLIKSYKPTRMERRKRCQSSNACHLPPATVSLRFRRIQGQSVVTASICRETLGSCGSEVLSTKCQTAPTYTSSLVYLPPRFPQYCPSQPSPGPCCLSRAVPIPDMWKDQRPPSTAPSDGESRQVSKAR